MEASPRIILGVDPGTLAMGYGLICAGKSKISLVEMGVLELARRQDHAERLQLIYEKIAELIRRHKPSAFAIEAPFFGKNVQSMLKLGRAQGVAIAAGMIHGLRAEEYAPRKIKQAVCGKGNATKEQVWDMLQHTLGFRESLKLMDASDAVAVALCHHYEQSLPGGLKPAQVRKKKAPAGNPWLEFAQKHPERVR